MKKGCLGCFGCGCLSIIIITVTMALYAYNWVNTEGRSLLAEGVQKVSEEACKVAFEPDSAAEIASLTKEIKEDLAKGNIGIVDSWNYLVANVKDNEKLQGQIIFAVIYRSLKGKVLDKNDKPVLVDEEGAEACRTIMYAMSQGKIDIQKATKTIAPLLDTKKQNDPNDVTNQFETKKVKKNVTKEDMEKVVEALKQYVKENNLETPAKDISADSLAKDEIIKLLQGLKKLKK